MKQHHTLVFALVVSAMTAACAPSINAAARADVDRRVAALSPSDRVVTAPAAAEPRPLAPGQWITLKQSDEQARPSFITLKIVGEENGAHWLEVTDESYYGRNATRMLVAFGDRRDPRNFDIRYVATRNGDGAVNVVPEPVIAMMRDTYAAVLDNLVIRWTDLPQEDAAVIAGSFTGCFKGRSTVSFAGHSATSEVWWHSEVPINGMVKSVGVDRPTSSELVAYGLSGATSEF